MRWIDKHLTISALAVWGITVLVAVVKPSLYFISAPLAGLAVLLSGAAFIEHLRRTA